MSMRRIRRTEWPARDTRGFDYEQAKPAKEATMQSMSFEAADASRLSWHAEDVLSVHNELERGAPFCWRCSVTPEPPARQYKIASAPPSIPPRWAKCATPASAPVTPRKSSSAP